MEPISVTAPVKINLYLMLTGRREDGYHLVDTLIVFGAFGDQVTLEPSNRLELTVTGPFAEDLPANEENLVIRALQQLREKTGALGGARVTLDKRIPLASGVGGGSADAAAAMLGACRLWGLGDDCREAVMAVAMGLGADVPACVYRRPCFASGIGQDLLAAPTLPNAGLVLVNPGIKLSTPAVFRERRSGFEPSVADADARIDTVPALVDFLEERENVLTNAATRLAPSIADVLYEIEQLPGCRLARMSGSGATCFGIFDDAAAAEKAAAALNQSGWWVQATEIRMPERV